MCLPIAHLILQENVRSIFYMQARSDLLEGRLLPLDWENAVQLSALLAHADEVKFDPKALATNEMSTSNTESLPTTSGTPSAINNQPSPSVNHKDTINKSKKRKLSKQKSVLDDDDEPENGAVIADEYSPHRVYLDYIARPDETIAGEMPADIAHRIAAEHAKIVKMPAKSAKYWLLEEIFKLPGFGEETFSGIIVSATNGLPANTPTPNCTSSHHDSTTQRCDISVGPHGLLLSTQDEQTR